MRDALDIFFEIIVAIAGAVFFSTLTIGLGALGLGCLVFGSCYSFLGWRRRRGGRDRD
jgi:hypothetical protein